jgi:hypothetical protein
VCTKSPLGSTPEIVREADHCDRGHRWHDEADHGANEWQAKPPVIDRLRPTGEHELDELTTPVCESTQIATRGAVLELELDLLHLEPCTHRIDRHPRLDAKSHGDREHGGPSPRREPPLARERLLHDEAGAQPDQRAGSSLRKPETPAFGDAEYRDSEISARLRKASNVAAKIGIAKKQWTWFDLPLGQCEHLTLPAPGQSDHLRTCPLRDCCCSIA